ncbi:uncharacterized protein LOC124924717 [Impatiens glandulifera]|uniref:uncharacterized protein LOC124924717 n=1 Tax=Impatiens glandulifera TaxID=253017 RepID=UPI001FB1840D|nr:uncharacterized protein LOC124924717 [Impatiens glandulifera]
MGNAAFCSPSIVSSKGVVKVLSTDGTLEIFTRPIKAGDLMLHFPGQFVCNSVQLSVGTRIPGLSPDEELNRRHLYFLLPMEILYSVLTHEEFNSLSINASKALKQSTLRFSKIFPVLGFFPSSDSKTAAAAAAAAAAARSSYSPAMEDEPLDGFQRQRSWVPALETIVETPPHNNRSTIV